MDHFHPPTHRISPLGLMLGGPGRITNRAMHLLDRCLHSLLQLDAAAQHCQPLVGLTPRQANGRHSFLGPLLQRHDMRLNITGGALGFAGQCPHLISHHGKTAPRLARARGLNRRVQCQQIGLLGDAVNHRQDHFDLFALLRQALNHLGPLAHLPGQRLDQPPDLGRGTGVLIGGLADIDHLPERRLHRLAFRLGIIRHRRQCMQALGNFITLQLRGSISPGIAQGHHADLHASTLGHIPRLTHDGLQLVDKTIDRRRHVTDLILAVKAHALGQIALAGGQIIQGSNQQQQLVHHPSPQHHGQQQQHAQADNRQPHAYAPAQGVCRLAHGLRGIGLHLCSGCLCRLQPRAQCRRAVARSALQAFTDQLPAVGYQGRETLIEGRQVLFNRSRGNPHQHFADLDPIGVDRGFEVVHRRIMAGRIEDFIQRPLAIALGQKGLVDRVVTIEIAGQMLPRGIVIHHKQHIGITLSATGEIGQRGHIIVPDSPRSHSGQQLRHIIGRILQVFLQRVLELHLLVFQPRFQARSETLARTGRQRFKAAFNVTPSLF